MKNILSINGIGNDIRSVSCGKIKKWWFLILLIFIATNCLAGEFTSGNGSFRLTVNYKEAKPQDTLILLVASKYLSNLNGEDIERLESVVDRDGNYNFKPKSNSEHGYWQLYKKTNNRASQLITLTTPFYWEDGDNLNLQLSNLGTATGIYAKYSFSGSGKEKYECRYRLEDYWKIARSKNISKDADEIFSVANKSILKYMLEFVDQNSTGMSELSIKILKEDLIFRQGKGIQSAFYLFLKNNKIAPKDTIRTSLLKRCRYIFSGRGLMQLDSVAMASSPNAISFIVHGLVAESYILFDSYNGVWVYDQIKQRYKGLLKDELIAYQPVFLGRNDIKADSLYQNALQTIQAPSARKQLLTVRSVYDKSLFSNYKLCNSKGEVFQLASLKGKVVIIDFWFTGCGYCKEYYNKTLSKVEEEFKNDKDVTFVSVSLDNQKEKWVQSIGSGQYTGQNSLNLYTCGEGFNHPIVKGINLKFCPTIMLIDKDNTVRYFNSTNLYEINSLRQAIKTSKSSFE